MRRSEGPALWRRSEPGSLTALAMRWPETLRIGCSNAPSPDVRLPRRPDPGRDGGRRPRPGRRSDGDRRHANADRLASDVGTLALALGKQGFHAFVSTGGESGDSEGSTQVSGAAARTSTRRLSRFRRNALGLERIIGLGLCDGGTALALFGGDAGLSGLILSIRGWSRRRRARRRRLRSAGTTGSAAERVRRGAGCSQATSLIARR
jgi:hypothetical protein